MTPASILIAADTPLLGDALRETLDAFDDFRVVAETHDARSAVSETQRLNPAVVLVSADLPGPGGALSVCSQVLKDESLQTLAVLVGGSDLEEHLLAALEAGALGYLSQQRTVTELVADIKAVLRGEARVPGPMLGAVLRGLVARQRQTAALLERYAGLSRRERQILGLLTRGQDHFLIAESLVISPETARTHIQRVLTKLGVHSRIEAAALALDQGWVSPEDVTGHE